MKMFAAVAVLTLLATGARHAAPPSCSQLLSGSVPPATVQASGPWKYRLTTEYNILGPQGAEANSHVVTGDFTAMTGDFIAKGEELQWTSVTVGQSSGHAQAVNSIEHQKFMEGLHYTRADSQKTTTADFFHDFPQTATDEKNLVWDELMFDSLIRHNLDKLHLNQPLAAESGDVPLAGAGTFTNRRIELTWTGIGQRHGEDCLLVHYEALLNTFSINSGPVTVTGRSDYMGDIWVSIRTHKIEYGTLLEEVAGTLANLPGSSGPQPLHVLRVATLEHLP
ncbi:MAG TPA: hypothetical protein VI685_19195 [Candidatus Angelobacter sp.]